MSELVKSHRAIGREVGRTETHIIIETAPQPGNLVAQPVHMTQPATLRDAELQIRFDLADLLERARFLGLDGETLQRLFDEEIHHEARQMNA